MISVEEARRIIVENVEALNPVSCPIGQAAGLILASDIYAGTDIPAFPQSSMDGYAFSFTGWQAQKKLKIIGEVAAGNNFTASLQPGEAVRIFTGAAVPPGADTVVMQEKALTKNQDLIIQDEQLVAGANVRPRGSEIKAGDLALEKETCLSPAAAGFLAGIGISDLKVYPQPTVGIIITGNELQPPGQLLQPGQVYESNSFSLAAALHQLHISRVMVYHAADDPAIVTTVLEKALQQNDVVLLTGGISVGDYDFVLNATEQCGVQKFFHKVKQRPGKPLYFGMKKNKPVFGLPGNPSSVLTCFYQYVVPALDKMGKRTGTLQRVQAPLAKPVQKAAGLTHFLKGYYDGHTARPLDAQESYRLRSFAKANCLIQVDEEAIALREGDPVYIYLLPA